MNTFRSGSRCTQINYLLMRIGDLRACKDCTVFLREACSSQHRLLALDTFFKKVQRKREGSVLLRILWKNMNEDAVEVFRKKVSEGATIQEVISTSNADCMRSTLARIIKNVAKETIGRKAHLLEDKQIPSVGVFDEVFLALGWLLEEIHTTWDHLEKEQTRLRTYTKSLEDLCKQWLETAS
ncbi:hypothetical protein Tco_0839526 [Tanacetum coccineum]|uniref:Uncharacterized protein n=1 Tax=Tanacetum coccineum TaxID=301880 RepID=A0ABQ5AVW3_9ASTR